ncbi:MAG: hypothetical protein NTU61_01030 [Candidatus Altiarchaeota archaeon]|nr:hypothetical protein [Candidatus Altiarchaeota archaeon]
MLKTIFSVMLLALAVSSLVLSVHAQPIQSTTTSSSSTSTSTTTSSTTTSTINLDDPALYSGLNYEPPGSSRFETTQYINSTLTPLPTPSTSTTTSTSTTICGGTTRYCSVELDSDGNSAPDCCTNESHPQCQLCLGHCIKYCGDMGMGLKSCFKEAEIVSCNCGGNNTGVCYSYTPSTIEGAAPSSQDNNGMNLVIIVTFVIVFIAFIGMLHFIGKF